jgi:hypothetical protein
MSQFVPSTVKSPHKKVFQREIISRILSSGMLLRVALVRTDVSEERIASIIRVKRIGDVGRTLAVTNNRHMPQRNIYL